MSDQSLPKMLRSPGRGSVAVAAAGLALMLTACAPDESPEVPVDESGEVDPQLVAGRDVYSAQCARCHSGDGSGGTGTALDQGKVTAAYPDVEDQIAVVSEGRRAMPAFGDRLDADQIEAVVRYTREVLAAATPS